MNIRMKVSNFLSFLQFNESGPDENVKAGKPWLGKPWLGIFIYACEPPILLDLKSQTKNKNSRDIIQELRHLLCTLVWSLAQPMVPQIHPGVTSEHINP